MAGTLKSKEKIVVPAVKQELILRQVFSEGARVAAIAGESNSGKTSSLVYMLRDFRRFNKDTSIVVYGFSPDLMDKLKQELNLIEINNLEQISGYSGALVILDEFQRLGLNSSKNKELTSELFSFAFHSNNWIVLSSPALREFNSVIGSFIQRWCLKSCRVKSLINGSQIKDIVNGYKGRFRSLGNLEIPKNKMVVISDNQEIIIEFPYEERDDTKKNNIDIFG